MVQEDIGIIENFQSSGSKDQLAQCEFNTTWKYNAIKNIPLFASFWAATWYQEKKNQDSQFNIQALNVESLSKNV